MVTDISAVCPRCNTEQWIGPSEAPESLLRAVFLDDFSICCGVRVPFRFTNDQGVRLHLRIEQGNVTLGRDDGQGITLSIDKSGRTR